MNTEPSLNSVALSATLHCLTGCAIGEVLGMIIGTALGFSDLGTIALAIVLAFFFGYLLTSLPLLRSGMALAAVVPIALASDTVSIAIMEIVDNAIMLLIPGAMDATLDDIGFYAALAVALVIAGVAAFPVNRSLIRRGKGHAVVHEHHAHHRRAGCDATARCGRVGRVLFRQVTHDDLGCASYLIGDEDAGIAAVVDPKLDIDEYLTLARYLGVSIEHVLETHTHADHVSGHGRLAAATGATIHIHRAAAPDFAHEPFDDGWELELGALRVRALHTPGHRPEHTAFLLLDTARGDDAPWAVLSGDSLFVGDVARPDLAVDREEGARGVFRSLHGRLLSLPGEVELWPGHLGGSMCGGPGMDLKVSSTIGFERAHNPVLGIDEEDVFVRAALATLGPQPPNFRNIVELNRGPLLQDGAEAHPLAPRQLERRRADGALLVDVRTELQFDEAHIPGAVCITALRAGFGTKLAWLADPGQDVLFVGRDDADGRRAATLAAAVGVTRVAGYLHGGMTAWREEKGGVRRTRRVSVPELHERWQRGGVQMLDVRERSEWDAGHIPGSVHVPYHDLHELPGGIDPAAALAVICASGQRASVGASLAQRHGAEDVWHVVDGGVGTWGRAGYELERP